MNRNAALSTLAIVLGLTTNPFTSVHATEQEQENSDLPSAQIVSIDEPTRLRGVSLSAADGEMVLAIPPLSLSQAGTVRMEFTAIDPLSLPDDWKADERGWSITLSLDEGIAITKPLTLVVKNEHQEYSSALARWDPARMRWQILPTVGRWKQEEELGQIDRTGMYALLVDTKHHRQGRATWYPDRLSKDTRLAAASNEYPLRTPLRVTNIQTNESVIVTVQSVGPFVEGRIIDLTKTAFSRIGYPRKQGVLTVVVEPLRK